MSFKIKQEKLAPELDSARSKLEGALQILIDKAEESTSSSEESDKQSPDVPVKEETSRPPSKKAYRKTQRKRKPKEELSTKNSYILKLFDRSVDLAQFPENTALYPVCRAWIRNKPYSNVPVVRSRSPTPPPELIDDGEEENDNNVYSLPLPRPVTNDSKEPRIPSPIPQTREVFSISSDDVQDAPSRETLLEKHMVHWRAVRQKWKDVSALNEERYKESADIFKKMFEQSMCREEANTATAAAANNATASGDSNTQG